MRRTQSRIFGEVRYEFINIGLFLRFCVFRAPGFFERDNSRDFVKFTNIAVARIVA